MLYVLGLPKNRKDKMKNRKQIASMLVAWRYAKNLTQTKVAKKLGVTFQQIQKYESTQNGISSERLLNFCQELDIPFGSFATGDCFQVIDGADISIFKKEKALQIIDRIKLDEVENDQSRSNENMAGESISQGTYI